MADVIAAMFLLLGILLVFLIFISAELKDSLINYLDAKAEELRARADSIRKEAKKNDEE